MTTPVNTGLRSCDGVPLTALFLLTAMLVGASQAAPADKIAWRPGAFEA
jgi:hypothetical protein